MFDLTPYRRGRRGIDRGRGFWDLDQMFDSMVEHFFGEPANFMAMDSGGIRVDIRESDKDYVLEAELPGVDKKDITLELRDDLLTICVEKDEEENEETENYIRRERRRGKLQRSFYVDNIKEDKIKAKFRDGILYIILPKEELDSPKDNQIEIE